MFGSCWYITTDQNGKTYYYAGSEGNGRRTWSADFSNAITWHDRDQAVDWWKKFVAPKGAVDGYELSDVVFV